MYRANIMSGAEKCEHFQMWFNEWASHLDVRSGSWKQEASREIWNHAPTWQLIPCNIPVIQDFLDLLYWCCFLIYLLTRELTSCSMCLGVIVCFDKIAMCLTADAAVSWIGVSDVLQWKCCVLSELQRHAVFYTQCFSVGVFCGECLKPPSPVSAEVIFSTRSVQFPPLPQSSKLLFCFWNSPFAFNLLYL